MLLLVSDQSIWPGPRRICYRKDSLPAGSQPIFQKQNTTCACPEKPVSFLRPKCFTVEECLWTPELVWPKRFVGVQHCSIAVITHYTQILPFQTYCCFALMEIWTVVLFWIMKFNNKVLIILLLQMRCELYIPILEHLQIYNWHLLDGLRLLWPDIQLNITSGLVVCSLNLAQAFSECEGWNLESLSRSPLVLPGGFYMRVLKSAANSSSEEMSLVGSLKSLEGCSELGLLQAQQKIRELSVTIRMKEELIKELVKTGTNFKATFSGGGMCLGGQFFFVFWGFFI